MAHKTFRALLAAVFTALAANCFLKYLWWTASYSAWSSIPKMAEQSKLASANSSFNGWSFLLLEVVAITVVFSLIRQRSSSSSGVFTSGIRLIAALFIAAAATGVFALALSWLKQGVQ